MAILLKCVSEEQISGTKKNDTATHHHAPIKPNTRAGHDPALCDVMRPEVINHAELDLGEGEAAVEWGGEVIAEEARLEDGEEEGWRVMELVKSKKNGKGKEIRTYSFVHLPNSTEE